MSEETIRPEFSKDRLLTLAGLNCEKSPPVIEATPGMRASPTEAMTEARKQELLEIANRH